MNVTRLTAKTCMAMGAVGLLAISIGFLNAQAPGGSGAGRGAGRGGGGRGPGAPMFAAVDTNGDDSVSRAELKAAFDAWYTAADKTKSGAVNQFQLQVALTPVFNKATPETVQAMMAALPTTAGEARERPESSGVREFRRIYPLLDSTRGEDGGRTGEEG